MKNFNNSNEEALRESLLNVQRLRAKEKCALKQSETLIKGLQILNESTSVSDIYEQILGTLQHVIPFDSAAILIETADGNLSSVVCTDDRLKFSRIPITGVFQRCLNGKSAVLNQLSRVQEWPSGSSAPDDTLSSAILVSLTGLAQSTLIICAGTDRHKLRREDLSLLTTFIPLATQAVKRTGEIEELNMLVSKLDYYAHYDMLTGLPNRTLFDIRLEQELSTPDNEFAVLFLDVDDFKNINDTYGHHTGDVLLSEIAFRFTGVIDKSDTIARMGGDEFALIIRGGKDIESLNALCERMLTRVSHPVYLSMNCIEPSVSIGMVTPAQNSGSAQLIMQNADIALYDAKHRGRGCFSLFNLQMKNRLNRSNEIEKRLKTALAKNELRLAYQPIVSSKSLWCELVEVLVRWEVDGVAQFYPDEFIPIAERTGVIREIGKWIFSKALEDLLQWLTDDVRRTVAINISDIQLYEPDFSMQLLTIATSVGIDPVQIELELSERIVASEINNTVSDNLEALQKSGFRFSFDDFGTGQSSFLNLQKFPGTTLKIDKTFVDEVEQSNDQRKLLMGIVNFAHSLDLLVVAEGVETDAQLRILQGMGCDYIQGYLLAKPMRLNDFIAGYSQIAICGDTEHIERKAG